MNYTIIDTQAIQIHHASTEVTINFHLVNPYVTVKNSSYISGVYDASGNRNLRLPACSVDGYDVNLLNNVRQVSATQGGEITLKLDTKYNEVK